MDGSAIFNFVQVEVPPLIESLLACAGASMDSVDYFLCHQPNRFMLQKLADKMKIPYAKMPSNVVEHFGNGGGATLPLAITFNFADRLGSGQCQVCLAGFGGGLTWASMLMPLGRLTFCEMIEFP
jgi:3-oxoacyl-[acyl-carrier-protein] synthase-3